MSHEKYADMLIDRANEIEKHSKLGQTNLNESRELYVVFVFTLQRTVLNSLF